MQAEQARRDAERQAALHNRLRGLLETRTLEVHTQISAEFAAIGVPFPLPSAEHMYTALYVMGRMTPTEMAAFDPTGKWREELAGNKAKVAALESKVKRLEAKVDFEAKRMKAGEAVNKRLMEECNQAMKDLAAANRGEAEALRREREALNELHDIRLAAGTAAIEASQRTLRADLSKCVDRAARATAPEVVEALMGDERFMGRLVSAVQHVAVRTVASRNGV